ncbi:MAG: NADH-quinone oxidoreductase subunit L [Polyangiaceae bacterium]|nr:NADH-quinone oxidoreductase subunit L [Polyangiaceae bacterium]
MLGNQFDTKDFALLAVVLLLPAIGAFVNGVFGKRLGKEAVRLMALTAIGGAFLASVVTFLSVPHDGGRLSWTVWRWMSVTGQSGNSVPIDVKFSVDAMTATMMLVVTGVGFLIHLYASEYMKKDPGYHRFFCYLNLFCFAMLLLITGDNLPVLFVGWEGVGMCSYLLIGFWFDDEKNARAGKKAFIVNRIGDFGLILAMALLVYYCGSLTWEGIDNSKLSLLAPVKIWPIGNLSKETLPVFLGNIIIPDKPVQVYAATLVALALFLGCAGKSAQVPLYIWLPDAMAGPTPVSALIHAATMVTAGVYLVARLHFVFLLSPAAMAVVAVIGVVTALLAASIGLFQHDLKKVLAYSTVSQLGFMFIGVGVGAFAAGFFHVFTHAFFKACLFLGAGSVIHAMHARIHDTDRSQDMRNMGGLKRFMPITRWTFFASCCAIAGFPLTAGFWSKDEILWSAFSNNVVNSKAAATPRMAPYEWPPWLGQAIYWGAILAATMTAFYMFRAYFMTFHGNFRGWSIVRGWTDPHAGHDHHDHHEEHDTSKPLEGPEPHESPAPMTAPLVVLAAFALFAGFLNAHPIHIAPLGHFLEPVFKGAEGFVSEREGAKGLMWVMMAPGFAAFLVGTAAAMYVYLNRAGQPEKVFAEKAGGLYRLIYDKWRIDELYDATVVGMVDALADIFTMADKWFIDGVLARLTAMLTALAGTLLRTLQTGRIQVYAAVMLLGLGGVGWFMVYPHADVTADDTSLRSTGEVKLAAAPGYGYTFRWEGLTGTDSQLTERSAVTVRLQPGEKKNVTVFVKNAFQLETSHTVALERPGLPPGAKAQSDGKGAAPPNVPGMVRPDIPTGEIPADDIHKLLLPRGADQGNNKGAEK